MTVTIDLSPETEARLTLRASALGKPLHDLVVDLVEEAASRSSFEGTDVIAHLREIGVVGAVRGKKRADGRSWSEVEAACDTH